MKKWIVRSLSALLLLTTLLGMLLACTSEPTTTTAGGTTAQPGATTAGNPSQLPTPDQSLAIRFSVLNGSTGYGAVKMISDVAEKKAEMNYQINVESSVKVIQDSLISGSLDLAALPTNRAAMIANTTDGKIQVVAVNTLGVMYLVTTDGTTISDFAALKGKTIGIPEEPSYILKALCTANGLNPETDLTVNTFATPSDLVAAVIKGEVTTAVLPEPLLSTAMSKKDTIQISMNLTEQWEKVYSGEKLMQGCIVVRTEWAAAHPAELAKFLEDYKASVEYVSASPDKAVPLIEANFGTAAAIAEKAIARCNLTYLAGNEMMSSLKALYEVLLSIPSSNIGGKVPSDSFYYLPRA